MFVLFSAVLAASCCLPLPGTDGRIAHLPSICPFYTLTGLPCPGCGLTRAFVCLGHGQWRDSLHWHPVGWLVYGIILLAWARSGITLLTRKPFAVITPVASRRLAYSAAAVLVVVDLARIGWLSQHHLRF